MKWNGNEVLGNGDGVSFDWDGLKWRPVPDSDDWFCWEKKINGFFRRIPADQVPDGLFVEMMKRSLL